MARLLSYVSILSTYIVNHIEAQTGAGCFSQSCPTLGQVRMDAIIENGQFVGGCNCACDPLLYEPNSAKYCPAPNQVNFDSRTLQGDCSCQCDPYAAVDPTSCVFPTTYDPSICGCGCPSWSPKPGTCPPPTEFIPELCQCACEIGSVGGPCVVHGKPVMGSMVKPDCTCDGGSATCQGNQELDTATGECVCPEQSASGAWYPACEYPLIKDPLTCDCTVKTTTLPPVGPVSVDCADSGDCGCPYGTKGECTITCDGTNDACKDGMIDCNSDGFDCTVNCLAGSSCAGSTVINGPVGAKLTVNCMGGQACEGSVVINNHQGTDTTIVCDGGQSCKGSVQFNFGSGYSRVACNGDPDSCQGGALFNLLPGAESIPGAAFLCTGSFCPNYAPVPFSNAPPPTFPQSVPNPTRPTLAAPTPAVYNPSPWTPYNPSPVNPSPTFPIYTNPNVPSPTIPTNVQPQPLPVQPRPAPVPTFPVGTGTIPGPGAGGNSGGNVIIAGTPPIPVVVPDEIVVCEGASCACSNTQACTIQCTTGDACKDSTLLCPTDYDCTLVCADSTCDKAQVTAPVGHDFTVMCTGESSCMNANFMAGEAIDVAYTCSGKDACKGASTKINCGLGHCTVDCSGEATCDSSDIMPHSALSFDCYGRDAPCPRSYTAAPVPEPTLSPTDPCFGMGECPCLNQQCFEERDPVTCECQCPFEILLLAHRKDPTICGNNPLHEYLDSACACDCPIGSEPLGGCPGGQIFNEELCQCECPVVVECTGSSILNPVTCQCECPSWAPKAADCLALNKVLRDCECQCPIACPGPGQIQSSSSCRCGCPFTTPDPASCASGFIDELYCQCAKPIKPPTTYCCLTAEAGFLPWAGRCWGVTDELSCSMVENNRCVWNPEQCLPDPPVNSIDPSKACLFRDDPCTSGADCCSEVCRVNGFCR